MREERVFLDWFLLSSVGGLEFPKREEDFSYDGFGHHFFRLYSRSYHRNIRPYIHSHLSIFWWLIHRDDKSETLMDGSPEYIRERGVTRWVFMGRLSHWVANFLYIFVYFLRDFPLPEGGLYGWGRFIFPFHRDKKALQDERVGVFLCRRLWVQDYIFLGIHWGCQWQ